MSRGHGHIQRGIIALIESDPEGAWTTADLCKHVYPEIDYRFDIEKKHRVAVTRALRKMTLPGTWCVQRVWAHGEEYCLCDECSLMSMGRKEWLESLARGWRDVPTFADFRKKRPHHFKPGKDTTSMFDRVQRAIKYRDADEITRAEMDLERAQGRVMLWTMTRDDPNCEYTKAAKAKRDELKAKLAELKAAKASTLPTMADHAA